MDQLKVALIVGSVNKNSYLFIFKNLRGSAGLLWNAVD